MYVTHELSYDRFLTNSNLIYRLEHYSGLGNELNTRYANINQNANPGLLNSIPGISKQTRFAVLPTVFIETVQKKISEPNFWVADSSFFSVFSFPFIKGSRKTALAKPNSLVITRKTAQKYFESVNNAFGETVTINFQNSSADVTITGIVENIPSNSHLQFDGIASSSLYFDLFQQNLSDAFLGYNYLQIKEGLNPGDIEKQLIQWSETTDTGPIQYKLQPITDIHLYSSARYEISSNSSIQNIYFFIAIAIILLTIASINYTSLSCALSLKRYKEAGLRKVLGASKKQIIIQFFFEAILLSLLVTSIVLLIIFYVLPHFRNLTGIPFTFSDFFNHSTVSLIFLTSVIVGILASIYPAVLLSSFQPIDTLRGISPSGMKAVSTWNVIVIIQFASSIALIICAITIYRQLNYMQTKDLGFNKERIITISNPVDEEYAPLKTQLENIPGVEEVSLSSYIPGVSKTGGTARVQPTDKPDTLTFNWISMDFDYFGTYDIPIKEGREFSRNYSTDSTNAFILNETAVKTIGWDTAIGKQIKAFSKTGTVIGITNDFNYLSLHENITPIIFLIDKSLYFNFSVRISQTTDLSEVITQVQNAWQNYLPNTPFEYNFVDDQFNALYKEEQRIVIFFGILTPLILFIACLGLFSLSSFMATIKRKEVGVRKVHGATLLDILFLFYSKFGKLILLASLIAIPLSIYFLINWLQNFAFKISLPFDIIILTVIAIFVIALMTVSYESIKAVHLNPIESLKKG